MAIDREDLSRGSDDAEPIRWLAQARARLAPGASRDDIAAWLDRIPTSRFSGFEPGVDPRPRLQRLATLMCQRLHPGLRGQTSPPTASRL